MQVFDNVIDIDILCFYLADENYLLHGKMMYLEMALYQPVVMCNCCFTESSNFALLHVHT